MSYSLEDIAHSVDKLQDNVSDTLNCFRSNNGMNDIAGLLALIQNNKNMDLPGLLALCRNQGYDRGWGNDGSFLVFFLLLFLFAGNGSWGGWGNQQAAAQLVGAEQLSTVTSLYDRISAAQAASVQGFGNLQTWLCESIANVTRSVRDQGDRVYDATRNVGDQVKSCCCALEASLASILCKVDGVGRDVQESTNVLSGKIELSQERNLNAMQAMECRLTQNINEVKSDVALGFERQSTFISNMFKDQEIQRLQRENESLKDTIRGDRIADTAVAKLQTFALANYTPTRTAGS